MENKELEVVNKKVSGMQEMIEKTVVTNDKELGAISDKIKDVKKLGKYVKGLKDEMVAPAKKTIELAKEWFDGPINQCKNAEDVLKGKAEVYMREQEEKLRIEQEKIAKKVETGYIKPETAVEKLEALPEEQKKVETGSSTLKMEKRKVAEITDPSLVPDEYWVIDEVRVRKEALEREKTGLPQIPGVTISERSIMKSL